MTGDLAPDVVAWIEHATNTGLVTAERLPGGMSSEVHRVGLADGSRSVLRHIVDRAWLDREPDLIRHEQTALELLAGTAVVAPRPIATLADEGLLLMTVVAGSWAIDAREVTDRATDLADVAAAIAGVALGDDVQLEAWRSWGDPRPVPPIWGDHDLWRSAIECWTSKPEPDAERPVLLHRDLHPLNVLWDGDRAGIVDWVNVCVGHPHAELGHCRWNLTVLAGYDTAEAFLDRYLAVTGGGAYDPWWDLATALSFLPGPFGLSGWHDAGRADLTQDSVIAATETFVRRAVERFR